MQEENTTLKEDVPSDDYRFSTIKGNKLLTTESDQILNPFLSKGNESIPNETKVQKTPFPLLISLNLMLDVIVAVFYSDFVQGILSIVCFYILQEEIITVIEDFCSDDHRLAIIKGSHLIATETGQIMNQILSKGNGNVRSEAKVLKALFLFYSFYTPWMWH